MSSLPSEPGRLLFPAAINTLSTQPGPLAHFCRLSHGLLILNLGRNKLSLPAAGNSALGYLV